MPMPSPVLRWGSHAQAWSREGHSRAEVPVEVTGKSGRSQELQSPVPAPHQ